ncbi:hypothetical protein [Paenibacillus sp. VMFN-D1]|uniref:hypothetical protein n=1 Tax=Paenibacillus sp. VMFN-D1 TaxID=2135608 RepID=UPI000E24E4CA|nr:hypothetical protein [Paenibacillus sp. VMFN-D1]RED32408.1 hypothetical protein C7820_5688 [Paenibacillus sp. VMFN-D1]
MTTENNLRDELLKKAIRVGGPLEPTIMKKEEEVIIEVYNPVKEKISDTHTRTSVQYRNDLHAEFKKITKHNPSLSREITNDLLELYLNIRGKILSEIEGKDRAH